MYLIAISNWKRKLIYLMAMLIIIALVAVIVPQMLGFNATQTDSQPEDEEILTQPIKVQITPDMDDASEIKLTK